MTGPDPAVARARTAVRTALSDLAPGERVLVACSGGPDSLALAAATAFVAARAGLFAGAVVVDHGWFAGSAEVAERAGEQCRALGLDPVLVVAADRAGADAERGDPSAPRAGEFPRSGAGGPEAAARTARYRELDRAAQRFGARAVLLGHTRDDQAETVLLGLLRGSGARSLAGMPPVRGVYRRPFLDLPATLTAQVCSAQGLQPWHDPANADPAYARSRLRAVLARVTPELDAALGGDLGAALARTAAQLAEDADALEAFAADLLAEARLGAGDAPLTLDAERLAKAPDAVRRRALLLAARRAGSPPGALGRRHVLAIDALVTRWRGQGPLSLPGGVEVRRACGRLLLDPLPDSGLGSDERRGDGSDDRP